MAVAEEDALRLTDVYAAGEDGYPNVRIPSIVVSREGTLLAFGEGRQGDDHSQNDIVLKRSQDGGATWGPLQVVHSAGELALNNPQAVVLRGSGRVLLMYQRNKLAEPNVEPGYDGEGTAHTLIQHSDDDGVTWSTPRDVTRETKRPTGATSVASGPGVGIELRRGRHAGRIIMPFNQGPWGRWQVYAACSDDGGESWWYGDVAPAGDAGFGNEVQMVEMANGDVLLNSRSHGGRKCRKQATSQDGGETWSPLRDVPELIDPQCMGSVLRYSDLLDGERSRILFANAASEQERENGTVRLSYDEGKTWPVARTVHPGWFAYSCLTVLPDGSVGLLYEGKGYRRITFARFTLDWLTGGADSGS